MDTLERHAVAVTGNPYGQTMVFAHGFGCDQHMWRKVAPAFESDFRVVLFDYVGAGASDLSAYDASTYSTLDGYADDIVAICEAVEADDVILVGHSVSSMIGALAAVKRPDLFAKLVMVGPSARYINDGDYVGGFTRSDIDDLLDTMESNYLGWSSAMAPAIMSNPHDPALADELEASFCRTDPQIAREFAEVTFTSDNRDDLTGVSTPTLVLQSSDDMIAPLSAGEFVRDHLQHVTYVVLDTMGHCPHLSAADLTIEAMTPFVRSA